MKHPVTLERRFPNDGTAEQAGQEPQDLPKTRVQNGLAGKIARKGIGDLLAGNGRD